MKFDARVSEKIRQLSFVATMLVVFLHSYNNDIARNAAGSFAWWLQEVVSQGITRIAVPYFFIIFGVMLFKDWAGSNGDAASWFNWWKMKICSRGRSLLLPYVLWSIIGTVMIYAVKLFAVNSEDVFEWCSPMWWLQILGVENAPKYMFHLWFVRAILIYSLFSICIGFLIERMWMLVLPVLFFNCMIMHGRMPDWLTTGLFFACAGAFIVIKRPMILNGCCRNPIVVASIGAAWLLGVICKVYFTSIGIDVQYVMFPLNCIGVAFFWLAADLMDLSLLNGVAHSAFFVYCIHWPFFPYVGAVLKRVSALHSLPAVSWFVTPLVVLTMSVLAWWFLKKSFPRVYCVLGGGR